MNLDILHKHIGKYDEQYDCLYPVYLLYPTVPKYEIYHDIAYFKPIVKKYCKEISINDVKNGDILIFSFYNGFHFGIYLENNKVFHCCKKFKLRISNLDKYKKYLIGCYRWQKH